MTAMLYVPADRRLARLEPNGIPVHVGGAALTSPAAVAALAAVAGLVLLSVRVLSARRSGGYAEGYVDGAAGRIAEAPTPEPEKSHLRPVN